MSNNRLSREDLEVAPGNLRVIGANAALQACVPWQDRNSLGDGGGGGVLSGSGYTRLTVVIKASTGSAGIITNSARVGCERLNKKASC